MKKSTLLSITVLSILPGVAFSQDMGTFSLFGTVNDLEVSADVSLNFSPGSLTVTIENTTSEDVGSFIDEFYLLRPLDNGSPASFSLFDTLNDPDWTQVNSLSDQFDNIYKGSTPTDYVGAAWTGGNSDQGGRISVPEPEGEDTNPRLFIFLYSGYPLDFSNWTPDGDPVFFLRWQGIGPGGGLSAKGWVSSDGIPGFEPSIPEPSHIAALALFGLGGLLLIRRRFMK